MLRRSLDSPRLETIEDGNHLLSAAVAADAMVITIPVEILAAEFLDLRTGVAGQVAQILANYGTLLVILGDIAHRTKRSRALKDYVFEANKGRVLWFLPDEDALRERLGREFSSPAPGP